MPKSLNVRLKSPLWSFSNSILVCQFLTIHRKPHGCDELGERAFRHSLILRIKLISMQRVRIVQETSFLSRILSHRKEEGSEFQWMQFSTLFYRQGSFIIQIQGFSLRKQVDFWWVGNWFEKQISIQNGRFNCQPEEPLADECPGSLQNPSGRGRG